MPFWFRFTGGGSGDLFFSAIGEALWSKPIFWQHGDYVGTMGYAKRDDAALKAPVTELDQKLRETDGQSP